MRYEQQRGERRGKRGAKGTSCGERKKVLKTASGVLNQKCAHAGCEEQIHNPCPRQEGVTTVAAAILKCFHKQLQNQGKAQNRWKMQEGRNPPQ